MSAIVCHSLKISRKIQLFRDLFIKQPCRLCTSVQSRHAHKIIKVRIARSRFYLQGQTFALNKLQRRLFLSDSDSGNFKDDKLVKEWVKQIKEDFDQEASATNELNDDKSEEPKNDADGRNRFEEMEKLGYTTEEFLAMLKETSKLPKDRTGTLGDSEDSDLYSDESGTDGFSSESDTSSSESDGESSGPSGKTASKDSEADPGRTPRSRDGGSSTQGTFSNRSSPHAYKEWDMERTYTVDDDDDIDLYDDEDSEGPTKAQPALIEAVGIKENMYLYDDGDSYGPTRGQPGVVEAVDSGHPGASEDPDSVVTLVYHEEDEELVIPQGMNCLHACIRSIKE